MNIILLLKKAITKKLLNPIDVYFSITIANQENPAIILAAACISYFTNQGNVCLPLSNLAKKLIFLNKKNTLINQLWYAAGNPTNWYKTLLNSKIVSNGSKNSPLIISKNNLYLNYLWISEKIIFKFIYNNKKKNKYYFM
ncbi:MAG TPA: hypothetical protein VK482_01055 [Buchnera sp. (in: enterobacteria)]|nr:hypothetical protein [Buchnera sp. (in: enterobacteria)]